MTFHTRMISSELVVCMLAMCMGATMTFADDPPSAADWAAVIERSGQIPYKIEIGGEYVSRYYSVKYIPVTKAQCSQNCSWNSTCGGIRAQSGRGRAEWMSLCPSRCAVAC